MIVKVVSIDHQKCLDGYWTVLKEFADQWEDDLLELKKINEISEEEVRAEAEVLDTFGYLIEGVYELYREAAKINDKEDEE